MAADVLESQPSLQRQPAAGPLILRVQARHTLRHDLPRVVESVHSELVRHTVQEPIGQLIVVVEVDEQLPVVLVPTAELRGVGAGNI